MITENISLISVLKSILISSKNVKEDIIRAPPPSRHKHNLFMENIYDERGDGKTERRKDGKTERRKEGKREEESMR
jgi:hypothetical protein